MNNFLGITKTKMFISTTYKKNKQTIDFTVRNTKSWYGPFWKDVKITKEFWMSSGHVLKYIMHDFNFNFLIRDKIIQYSNLSFKFIHCKKKCSIFFLSSYTVCVSWDVLPYNVLKFNFCLEICYFTMLQPNRPKTTRPYLVHFHDDFYNWRKV